MVTFSLEVKQKVVFIFNTHMVYRFSYTIRLLIKKVLIPIPNQKKNNLKNLPLRDLEGKGDKSPS
jgi:hypothetical protein